MKPAFQLSLALIALLFVGCNPRYYIPNTQNVPLIKSKNQVNINISGNSNQAEVQGAYGLTDAWAVQVNGAYIATEDKNTGNGGDGQFYEAGLGYYKNLGESFLFDTYALGGIGTMKNTFPTTLTDNPATTGKISGNLLRAGIQPSLSYLTKYFSISGSARLLSLNYSNIGGSLIFENTDQVKYLKDNNANVLIEPAITIRAGIEKVKLQVQIIRSYNLSNAKFKQDFSLLSFGLNYNF